MASVTETHRFDPATTTRPVPALLKYYAIVSCFGVVFFPVIFLPLFCKYQSLRYKFDDEGVSMSWGILFKREVYLTYRRVQDIHVSRGIIQRHLGLATVSVQTASGSIGAQMSIEGVGDPEGLRDYLYSRMRGSRDDKSAQTSAKRRNRRGPRRRAFVLLRQIHEQVRAAAGTKHGGGGRCRRVRAGPNARPSGSTRGRGVYSATGSVYPRRRRRCRYRRAKRSTPSSPRRVTSGT
ncbi:MAG: PH domain-containing protein [Phycisphaerales bacterium]